MNLIKLTISMLIIGVFLGCIGSRHTEHTSQIGSVNEINYKSLENKITDIEQKLGARVGVSLYDVETKKESWSYKGDTRFPLMSTFKTLACAKVLLDVEKKKVSFDSSVLIKETSLITWSPVTKDYVGQKFSLKQACTATMVMSDNTAANIILEKIGGPNAVTIFMRTIGDNVTRLDRIEPELGEALEGDARDTTTPNAMVKSLHVLLFGNVLSDASKTQLKQWMMDNKVSDSLFRSVLPSNWAIADRSGAGGYGSRGITAVVWSETRPPLIICVYVTQTKASFDERNKAIAEIGRKIFELYK
jgi:beta-lactamase class A